MNKNIGSLIAQTDIWCDQNFPGDPFYEVRWEEKFAELIVRECVERCEFVANMATITNTGEMARKTKATADSCASMIKQHFGVEE